MTDQGSGAHAPSQLTDLSGSKVVVTGATGFIGSALVTALKSANAEVTALVRSNHGVKRLRHIGIEAKICKLETGPALDRALQGQDMVFHFAYDVRAPGAQNFAAFNALYEAAKTAQVKRFIHASSIVVYDDWPVGRVDENASTSAPGGGDYRQTKIAMEQALLAGDLPAAILQPTIVYGPGSALWVDGPRSQLQQGPVILPDPVGTCAAVYVDDVVSGALAAAQLPDLGQERFILTGPDRPTWATYFKTLAAQLGQGDVGLRPYSDLIAQIGEVKESPVSRGPSLAAKVSAQLRRVIGNQRFETIVASIKSRAQSKGPVFPTPFLLRLYSAHPELSSAQSEARLGFTPAYDLAAGMAALLDAGRRD